MAGWWFGTMEFYDFPFSRECHHPNWRTHIFQRGRAQPPTRKPVGVPAICFEETRQLWDLVFKETDRLQWPQCSPSGDPWNYWDYWENQHFQNLIPCKNSGGRCISIALHLVEKHEHFARIHHFIPVPFLVVIFARFRYKSPIFLLKSP